MHTLTRKAKHNQNHLYKLLTRGNFDFTIYYHKSLYPCFPCDAPLSFVCRMSYRRKCQFILSAVIEVNVSQSVDKHDMTWKFSSPYLGCFLYTAFVQFPVWRM
jgi:hypothetical protein